jgi:hypothetical protein
MAECPTPDKRVTGVHSEESGRFNDLGDLGWSGTRVAMSSAQEDTTNTGTNMRMHHRADPYGYRNHRTGFERVAASALDYLRSRSSEHWLMFFAGLVVGVLLG